ncbi:MAG: hypothetical protein FWG33_04275, partial [Oscillospiraceae bacterium]|nr:hypothetical protein [Oscillospiraceae bacterium]
MINGMNKLRFGGMNSGLDTDAIVKAMSGATRMRLNNNKRKVLMLQAQQSAYQDVISKFQKFQDTYFNIINTKSFLKKGTSIFGQTSAKVYTNVGGVETLGTPAGVSVSTATGATPASYKVELLSQASQATIKGKDFAGNSAIDFAAPELAGAVEGDHFAFSISVGGVSKNIVIDIRNNGGTDETIQEAMNRALKDAFGASNTPGKGLVSVNNDGIISSSEGKAISLTNIIKMSDEQILDFDALGMKNGNNSILVQVDDELLPITFRTVDEEYFNIFFDSLGNFVSDSGKEAHLDSVALQRYNDNLDKAFADWMDLPTTTPSIQADMREQAFQIKFAKAVEDDFKTKLDAAWTTAFGLDPSLEEDEWKAEWTKTNEKTIKDAYKAANETSERTAFSSTTTKDAYEIIYNDYRFTS